MKKSTLIIAMIAAALTACTTTQLRQVDGKQQEVFVTIAGTFADPSKTKSQFNDDISPCYKAATTGMEGKYPERFIPFNYPARNKHRQELHEIAIKCMTAKGYRLIEAAPGIEQK